MVALPDRVVGRHVHLRADAGWDVQNLEDELGHFVLPSPAKREVLRPQGHKI